MPASSAGENELRASTDLVWPAAAGNVAWSLISLAITHITRITEPNVGFGLLSLALVAWYLFTEWLELVGAKKRSESGGPSITRPALYLDFLWVLLIVIFALTTAGTAGADPTTVPAYSTHLLYFSLLAVFGIGVVGYGCRIWPESGGRSGRKVALNVFGALIAGVWGWQWEWWGHQGPYAVSLGIVLVLWHLLGLQKVERS